jgi:hypothetical protein
LLHIHARAKIIHADFAAAQLVQNPDSQGVSQGFKELRLELTQLGHCINTFAYHNLPCQVEFVVISAITLCPRMRRRLHLNPSGRRPMSTGEIVPRVFTPVLAKHSKSFSLIDCVSVGVDRMQRNFEPMRKQVEAWQRSELTDVTAKVVIYEAFVEAKLEAPKHLARTVHDLYFEPKYEEFRPRTIWSLSNAFTSAFKELDPIPQFKATAKLGEFLEARFSHSF